MLRQLARLTQPLPAAGPTARAVAVYADATDRLIVASESGFEGVACVDDAARVLEVLCDVWARTRQAWSADWAHGLLEFVLWMQEEDGRWLNFVQDWDGTKNRHGITSVTGENFWHARALVGVSHAWLTFGDVRAEEAMHRGLDHAVTKPAPPDVRALHIFVARRLIVDAGIQTLVPAIRHWVGELADQRDGDVLMNAEGETGTPHLWAHVQEGVLASSAVLLEDPALLQVAVRSAEALLVPVVEDAFPLSGTTPYDVASCIYSLDRLFEATEDERWEVLAMKARAWFDGRNPAGLPVYDRRRGRVADGIDDKRLSENSGAESNVVAAEALLPRALEEAVLMDDPLIAPPPDPGPE
ncbi:MAG: hypothetical protein ACM3OO_07660 [Planctomycetaceae bacterium]